MAIQLRCGVSHHHRIITSSQASSSSPSLLISSSLNINNSKKQRFSTALLSTRNNRSRYKSTVVIASSNTADSFIDSWKPNIAATPPLSDIVWPSVGAFAAMAILGKMDQMLAPRGISMSIAPLGAVCAILFVSPSAPAARKYNMFMAQIACAAIGVLAFSIFGPGWLARSAALGASVAFMIYTHSVHPPAASLPIMFIDAAKLHHLTFWYALFPGATGCILLCLIQQMVCYMKDNYKF